MKKTYIIIAVVIVVLWGGFMGYRHMKKKEGNQAHHSDTYNRMVEAAKKSPRAGLTEMGLALNRYYKDNKQYPNRLEDLYPKYIASRPFITDINWEYEADDNDFSLRKSVVHNNRELAASVDKSLRPVLETGTAVARRPEPTRRRIVGRRVQEEETPEEEPVSIAELEIVDEIKMTGEETNVVAAAAGSDISDIAAVRDQTAPKEISVQREMSRIVAQVGPEIVSQEKTDFVSRSLERYLVWKNSEGVIGVGNIQYPEADNMYVAVYDTWYNVKRRQSQITPGAEPEGAAATERKAPQGVEQMALDLSRNYLVWKDENGVIGVGNTQFPDTERLTIASRENWEPLERKPLAETVAIEEPDLKKEPVDADQLGANLSRNYLVWKDENGVIGVGNVQFPERERLEIASREEWRTLKNEPLSGAEGLPGAQAAESSGESSALSAGVGHKYLIWKDENGVIGFGNVAYPDSAQASYVHSEQSWEKIVN